MCMRTVVATIAMVRYKHAAPIWCDGHSTQFHADIVSKRGNICMIETVRSWLRERIINRNRMPNDEIEQERLDLVWPQSFTFQLPANSNIDSSYVRSSSSDWIPYGRHWHFPRCLLLLKGELHNAPVQDPRNILDLGTGTGIWALDIAE